MTDREQKQSMKKKKVVNESYQEDRGYKKTYKNHKNNANKRKK